ncbi:MULTISPECIES: hypothetical protein [Clostridium]|uniref:Uncharacterized protein n=2 Tax=root TaxID=1 RepID=R9C6W2_9CLOT|nr:MULTISPECIES: hypothetical protein [Clostridium]EOR25057.1 hypothetical protein A500_11199 [Clostridium sartagoforme AAU1]KLE15295.1 hypothetical protein AAT22_12325 [Clostridium sp. C8]
MSEDKWSKSILISGGIVFFVTILIYFIGCRNIIKVPMVLLSLLFIILAEVVTFLITAKTKKDVLRSSVITALSLYLLSTIVLALVFVNILMVFLTLYIIINIVLMGITGIALIILNNFADRVNESNNRTLAAEGIMIECESRIQSYMNNNEYSEHKEELNKIYENIKYSDISSECDMEGSLLQKIEGISENKEKLPEYLKEISFLIKERNIKVKSMKKGSI